MLYRMAVSCLIAIPVSATSLGGELNPPSGPVVETGRFGPRTEINQANTPGDPDASFRITQPGSYYLAGNLLGEAGKNGIDISADGVTLDLMGFELQGVANSDDGIFVSVEVSNVHIFNGSARGWGADGAHLNDATNSSLRDILFTANGGNGLVIGGGGVVESCSVSFNGSTGIAAGEGSLVNGCTAFENLVAGISAGQGSVVTGCSTASNGFGGIFASFGSVVRICTALANTGDGISAGACCRITDNVALFNSDDGIAAAEACTVSGNVSNLNTGDGIEISRECYVLHNTCEGNGTQGDGAGIHAASTTCRIESNSLIENTRGLDVDGTGNLIVRNSATGNTTNYEIVVGNSVAPIVQTMTNAVAISGSAYAGPLGTTDPWANFSY